MAYLCPRCGTQQKEPIGEQCENAGCKTAANFFRFVDDAELARRRESGRNQVAQLATISRAQENRVKHARETSGEHLAQLIRELTARVELLEARQLGEPIPPQAVAEPS